MSRGDFNVMQFVFVFVIHLRGWLNSFNSFPFTQMNISKMRFSKHFQSWCDYAVLNVALFFFNFILISRSHSFFIHSAPPGPTNSAGICSNLADSGAENCVGLWVAWGVCAYGHRYCSSTSFNEAAGWTYFGSKSTGEEMLQSMLFKITEKLTK